MTKFNYIPYFDKRTNKPCMLEDNPHELTKTFKYEDGSEKIVSIATFKRWYKKVEDEPFVFVDKTEPEVSVTVPVDFTKEPTDPSNLSAIDTAVKELTEKLKEEKEKNVEGTDTGSKEREKKTPKKKTAGKRNGKKDADKVVVDKNEYKAKVIQYAEEAGVKVKTYEKIPNQVVGIYNGHPVFNIYTQRSSVRVNLKGNVEAEGYDVKRYNNYHLPVSIKFGYDNFERDVKKMIELAIKG